ncbi:hypothetical protein E3N88_34073 [Mikania micrantha]|uniref:Ubiquitin-like protein ATG12 n=1 Tax=Mikania micrantha TaxID=192012 RepID=A0A5N6MDM7_9ASTR|nr:hypothetical protein E3N88_34073 [Mikania micrantha]
MASESPIASRKGRLTIAGTDKFSKVIDFLCRQLHRETLFVYVNSAFSPSPDELVNDLYDIQGSSNFPLPKEMLDKVHPDNPLPTDAFHVPVDPVQIEGGPDKKSTVEDFSQVRLINTVAITLEEFILFQEHGKKRPG